MSTLDQAGDALREGSPAEAVPLLQAHLREHPDDTAALQLLAQACGRAGDWPQTEHAARRLTALEPEDARHWYVLGVALRKQRRYAEAREALGRALDLQPGFGAALAELQEISREGERMTIHEAAEAGDTDTVEALLEGGANVNARDQSGRTPLHLAAEEGHTEIAKLLLDRGAEISAQDQYGQTPLQRALAVRHFGVTQLLRDRGGLE